MASNMSHGSAVHTRSMKRRQCLVLIGGMYNLFVAIGVIISVNTLYVELLDVFQATRKETSFVQTTLIGMTYASGLITGIIVDYVGIKISLMIGAILSFLGFFLSWFATSVPYLIATLGVIGGLGSSFIFISTTVFIAMVFNQKRSLALALLMVGSGLGQILVPLLLEQLLDVYEWRGSLLITSGLYLNVMVSCLLTTSSLGMPFRLTKTEGTGRRTTKKAHWQSLCNPVYLTYVLTAGISFALITNIIVLFMDFLDSQGQSLQTSVNVFMGYSAIGLLARFGVGALNLCKCIHSDFLFSSASILPGCALLLLRISSGFTSTVVLLLFIGAGFGGMAGMMNIVPIDLLGVDNAALATGLLTMCGGILTPVAGVLIGWIFDTTRSYSVAFDICGYIVTGASLVNMTAFGIYSFLKKRRTRPERENRVETNR